MNLVANKPFEKSFRIRARTLSNMLYDGLMSSMGRMETEYKGKISREVVELYQGNILSGPESSIYLRIKRSTLKEFGARSERDIFMRKQWAEYRHKIDHATMEVMDRTEVHERYWIRNWEAIAAEDRIDNRAVIETAIKQLVANYKKNKGGMGDVSPEAYKEFLVKEARHILDDPTFTPSKAIP